MRLGKSILLSAAVAACAMTVRDASALSCVRPTIEGSFNSWVDSPETYFIGKGRLTPLSPLPAVPSVGDASQGASTDDLRAVYRFEGHLINADSLSPLDHVIWVRVSCAGPWCGGFPNAGTEGVMALRHRPDLTLEVGVGACPGAIFADPTGDVTRTVQSCIQAGRCPEPGGLGN